MLSGGLWGTMAVGRAVLTASEREYLAGEHGEQRTVHSSQTRGRLARWWTHGSNVYEHPGHQLIVQSSGLRVTCDIVLNVLLQPRGMSLYNG